MRPETSPDDLHGMIAAEGILTSRGGLVSHAAVVARGMGKPAICGADALKIDLRRQGVRGRRHGRARRRRHLDLGHDRRDRASARCRWSRPNRPVTSRTILGWADELRTLKVRTNADLPEDAAKAREFGAEGIGLCRTEHMFLGDRLPIVQRMILAETPGRRGGRARRAARAAGGRLRRHPRGDGRSAGHGAAARPAAARVPARSRRADRQGGARHDHRPGAQAARAPRRCGASRTRCSARGAAGSASSSPACTACRRGADAGRGRPASRRAAIRSSRS